MQENVPLLPINQYFFDMMYLGMPTALLQIVWTASKSFPLYPLQISFVVHLDCLTGLGSTYSIQMHLKR